MATARWIPAPILLLLVSVICGCALPTGTPKTPAVPPADLNRYYLTVRVVDSDRQTPVKGVSVGVRSSGCSPGDRSLNASKGEKIEPSVGQATGPQGTVLFALTANRKLRASIRLVIRAQFSPEKVEAYQNLPVVETSCSYCWNPDEQGDCEFTIAKPGLRIIPSVAQPTSGPRDSVHVMARILNLAAYPVDFSVAANQAFLTSQPPVEGRIESGMSGEWSSDVSAPENGWGFGVQSISLICYQIDEEDEWLQIVSTQVYFTVPSSQ